MKKLALLLVTLMAAMGCYAQVTTEVSEAFSNAPNSVFPLLDMNTRLDMIDYFKNGMTTPSQNALEGKSQITEMTADYMDVKMTDSSTAQLIVLPAGKQEYVALINTVAAPGLDSNMKVFLLNNGEWGEAQLTVFAKPGWKEWLTDGGQSHRDQVEMKVPFMLVSYKYDPASKQLVLTNNLSKFLDKDLYEDIAMYLRPQLVYTWNGSKFAMKK
ncbi:MAG: DUF3256 family protein [Duncaniella sp.]|nr:DUF3256 family protein [Muribaculum sp.]MCM1255962.1 DUF3256 family protein [Duncaniella sp.]